MFNWLKLSHRHHSGHLRPHEHTSYIPLSGLLFAVGMALVAYTTSASSPGPEASSIGLTGVMPGKPPTVGAVIKTPASGFRTPTSPITLTGTCPDNTLVEIFKNDIFAGSTPCETNETFSIEIDLLIGQNTVTAQVYDALNQTGPDTQPITIYYDALPTQAGALTNLSFGGSQLLLNTDAVFRGVFPNQELSVPIDILGGTPPYAINVQWGDSNNKVVSRNDNTNFKVGHIYKKPGTYQVSIQASDSGGRVAFLTVASIVNGQPSTEIAGPSDSAAANKLLVLWPLYVGAIATMASFWIGEKREKSLLKKHGLLLNPPTPKIS